MAEKDTQTDTELTVSQQAIRSVNRGQLAFCRFLAAIDTGAAHTHQSGIYMPAAAWPILFDRAGTKGENRDRTVKVCWQGEEVRDNRFVWYGEKKREYRITRFGRNFSLLDPENTGSLMVLVKMDTDDYEGWVLTADEEIEEFLDYFGLSATETNRLLTGAGTAPDAVLEREVASFIDGLGGEFPTGVDMSQAARNIYDTAFDHVEYVRERPDERLLQWTHMEYELFQAVERVHYAPVLQKGFATMEEFVDTANSVLNRRKSRAGKSLEYHLEAIFRGNGLPFGTQVVTEQKKKPDFIFPGGEAYHNPHYPADKLIVLGAKTTCKERWRQVVTEADRVKTKYLCTLQQGNSPAQLREMRAEHVVLVVPEAYIVTYPPEFREEILSLAKFIGMVREKMASGGCVIGSR